jgi:hypothetical protein
LFMEFKAYGGLREKACFILDKFIVG